MAKITKRSSRGSNKNPNNSGNFSRTVLILLAVTLVAIQMSSSKVYLPAEDDSSSQEASMDTTAADQRRVELREGAYVDEAEDELAPESTIALVEQPSKTAAARSKELENDSSKDATTTESLSQENARLRAEALTTKAESDRLMQEAQKLKLELKQALMEAEEAKKQGTQGKNPQDELETARLKREEPKKKPEESPVQTEPKVIAKANMMNSTSAFEVPPISDTSIRRWGCARNETPFIFVHVGKAGGGGVRARIAASAANYSRGRKWFDPLSDESYYYPVYDEQGNLHQGKLMHSRAYNLLPHLPHQEQDFPFQRTFRFESSLACHATTPIGHAVACHVEKEICETHRAPPSVDKDRCDTVYMGHNAMGGEMNFLPTGYLLNWWNSTPWARQDAIHNAPKNQVATRLANRYKRSDRVFDPKNRNRALQSCMDGPLKRFFYNKIYEKCIRLIGEVADSSAQFAMGDIGDNYGPLYASMPVMRVTMLREPFSWFKSKFFWMENHVGKDFKGLVLASKGTFWDNMRKGKMKPEEKQKYGNSTVFIKCDDEAQLATGWGRQTALEYIFYLCGEHCMGKWQAIQESNSHDPKKLKEKHSAYLKVMEEQAAYNLRNSFAVVGLLQETDEFFDMITKRVHYMDTSLNPDVMGKKHGSGSNPEQQRCSKILGDKAFQMKMMTKCPEIAVAVRLYKLAVEVNRFQKEELEQCTSA